MGSGASLTAEPPDARAPQVAGGEDGGSRGYGTALLFLAPAAFFLIIWIVYPTVYTGARSFFGLNGFNDFVGVDNYKTIVTTPVLRTAIKNNAVWVAVVPALVTAIGLIFAVLTERISWSVAFKTAVFMPMAISLFATGVIWRLMDQKDPNQGTVNAIIGVFYDAIHPPGTLQDALPATSSLVGSPKQGFVLKTPVQPGGTALLALTGIPPEEVPAGATQAVAPPPAPGSVGGVVWRDFKPGGGTPGKVEPAELGLPGVKVELRDSSGKSVQSATSQDDGAFVFSDVPSGSYRVAINSQTFQPAFGGVNWLGPKLITPSIMIAYIWVWAGFSMVVIAAGLAAIPRDTLEAARTDGASEWQIFRRITVPLLAPVLSVVFITMLINVLKVFDIVLSVAPGSTQSDATVIALQMWRTSFGGVNDFGVGSAIAVFLFVLVIPVLALNVRRFRRET
jgi:alpha-glucoside transport system permease protein